MQHVSNFSSGGRMKRLFVATIFGFICIILIPKSPLLQTTSNNRTVIKGRITDAKTGLPLIGANVYLSNTMKGSATDIEGHYLINNIPQGNYSLVVSYVGYKLKKKEIRIASDDTLKIDFRLTLQVKELSEAVITGKTPKDWKKHLKRFKKEFFGNTENAKKCKILNPEVLSFKASEYGLFQATAEDFIKVENKALGYVINVSLGEFMIMDNRINFWAETFFEELTPKNDKEETNWKKNRTNTYAGSIRHFLQALLLKSHEAYGFKIQLTSALPPDDYYYVDTAPDSLYRRGDKFFENILDFEGVLKIEYLPGINYQTVHNDLSSRYNLSQTNFKTKATFPTTWIVIKDKPVIFDYSGYLKDPYQIYQYGYWPFLRFADMLPREFDPAGVSLGG